MDAALAPTPQTLTELLADYLVGERFETLGEAVVERVKQVISYHVGLAFRSIRLGDLDARQAVDIARDLSEGAGSCTIIGHAERATAADAAFANCTMMRAFGFDDVIFPSGIHPGLVTLPVAFAIAERRACSGAELITALAAAYEVMGKFGRWNWSAETPRRSIMTFGAFGSIATAGRLMGFDRERMARAMGYAAHMAMGLAEGGLSTGPVTHYYSLVCRNGIIGASICETGGGCSPHVLEGRFGFLETFFGSAAFDRDGLAASLGHDHQVLSACEKRYPGTALNQVPIELLRAMVADHGLTAAMVERVRIEIPQERANFDAGHFMGPFTNRGSATSSVAFQLAIVLLDGDIVAARYDQPSDPAVADIVARMEIALVREKPIRYARLTIETTDGRTFCREGETFQFPPEPPRVVLHREAEGLLPRERIDRFADLLETLEELDDASQLTRCLAL